MYQTEKKILAGYRQHSPNAHIPVCGTKLPLRQFSLWQQYTIIMVIFCTTDLLLIQWTQRVQAGRERGALLPEAHCLELGCYQEKWKIHGWNSSEKRIPLPAFPFLAKCFQSATPQRLSPAAEATSSHGAWHLHTCPPAPCALAGFATQRQARNKAGVRTETLEPSDYILFFGSIPWLLTLLFQQSSS